MSRCPMGTQLYTIRDGDSLQSIANRYHTSMNAIVVVNPGIDFKNLSAGQVICLRPGYGYYSPQSEQFPIRLRLRKSDLKDHLRMLWEQHVFWTRLAILSMVFNLPDEEFTANRLLQNPKAFESAVRPFYGKKIASKFAALLTEHLEIAAELVKAAKLGDEKAASIAESRWYANADAIAAFLSSINPYWSEKDWRAMLHKHLALTKAEAVSLLTQKYVESIALFNDIEKQALEMADTMALGIIKQFPYMFTV